MKIPNAYVRAQQRLRESATPLYSFIMDKLQGSGLGPLGRGPGALTSTLAKAIQRPGRRGYLDINVYEPPGKAPRVNKFSTQGALPFTGLYPPELCTPEGREILYSNKIK